MIVNKVEHEGPDVVAPTSARKDTKMACTFFEMACLFLVRQAGQQRECCDALTGG